MSQQERMEQRPRDAAEQTWIDREIGGRVELPGEKPCYFNTGCCSFSDGSITAIEMADGEIRLVRWRGPDEQNGAPTRELLFAASLTDVFQAVAASR